jgi:hypothetical protein
MSPSPDPDISAPRDPADYRPRPLLGVTFWAMIAFGVICVLGGVALATFGPKLLAHAPTLTVSPEPAVGPERPAPIVAPVQAAPLAAPEPAAASADVDRLSARVAALETHETQTSQAAAAALAAAAAVEASQGSGPFADQIAGLAAISPPSPELSALVRLADAGAPSRAALAASFPDYAARAAAAARAPADGAGLAAQIGYELSRIVTLRRVGDVPGDSVDALLARAERQVEDGDLDQALRTLDRLPAKARDALGGWRTRAERRAEIDRNAAALRARALQTLTAAGGQRAEMTTPPGEKVGT